MNNSNDYLLVLGAAVIDIFGFCNEKYKAYNSTPGNIKISYGGVCRNIAENMARVGVKTKFISILGDDENGYNMMEHSKKIGYDMADSLVLSGKSTPTYLAILNENGEMVSAIADMQSIDEMSESFIDSKAEIIENAEYTFLDSDNPKIMEYILKKFQGKTKFVLDPVSAAKSEKIPHLIKYFHTVKPNRHEAEALVGFKIESEETLYKAAEYFMDNGVKNIFISLDEDGIYYCNKNESGRIKANNVKVKNVTGAGDAFVAGIGYGYKQKLSMRDTVKFAITMSNITISHKETIHPDMCYEKVMREIEATEWIENYK